MEVLCRLVVVDVHGNLHSAVLRVVVVAPDAGRIFFLKGEFVVTQHVLVLIGRVHVKEEHAALLHEKARVGNGRVQVRDVVEGVKGGHCRPDGAVEVELEQILPQKQQFYFVSLNYLMIVVTVPAPTVGPPSRMENFVPFSIATG